MTEPTKYALVTGGSRGIGREICLKLARSGYYVLINYRSNADEAQRTLEGVRAAGGDGETLRFDVAAGEETAAAIAAWQERHKGAVIEVVVNNAGIRCGWSRSSGTRSWRPASEDSTTSRARC